MRKTGYRTEEWRESTLVAHYKTGDWGQHGSGRKPCLSPRPFCPTKQKLYMAKRNSLVYGNQAKIHDLSGQSKDKNQFTWWGSIGNHLQENWQKSTVAGEMVGTKISVSVVRGGGRQTEKHLGLMISRNTKPRFGQGSVTTTGEKRESTESPVLGPRPTGPAQGWGWTKATGKPQLAPWA